MLVVHFLKQLKFQSRGIEYGIPMLSSASIPWEGVLVVSCNVSNTGPRAAREVVQLYVHDQVASRVRPLRELTFGADQQFVFNSLCLCWIGWW